MGATEVIFGCECHSRGRAPQDMERDDEKERRGEGCHPSFIVHPRHAVSPSPESCCGSVSPRITSTLYSGQWFSHIVPRSVSHALVLRRRLGLVHGPLLLASRSSRLVLPRPHFAPHASHLPPHRLSLAHPASRLAPRASHKALGTRCCANPSAPRRRRSPPRGSRPGRHRGIRGRWPLGRGEGDVAQDVPGGVQGRGEWCRGVAAWDPVSVWAGCCAILWST